MDSHISLQKSIQEVVKRIKGTRKWEECCWGFMTYVAVLLISMCIIMILQMITDSEGIMGMPWRAECLVGLDSRAGETRKGS